MIAVQGFSHLSICTAGEITNKNQRVSQGKKTTRLVFKNPLEHSLLNIAIKEKKALSSSKKWVPLTVDLEKGKTCVLANVNSLAKRLNISSEEIWTHSQKGDLEAFINQKLQKKEEAIEKEFTTIGEVKAPSINKRSISSLSEKVKAKLADLYWGIFVGSFDLFRLRFLLKMSDENLQKLSEAKASAAFRQAAKQVPAYKQFLKEHRKENVPKTFDEIPVMDKDSYIKKHSMESTLIGGKLPKGGQIDTSTGTTGKPSVWVHSSEERELNRKLINYVRKAMVGDNIVVINAFALGAWATGMTVHNAMVDKVLAVSPGPDHDKVLDMITEFGKKGRKIVISGYPPFINRLIDKAKEKGIDLKQYELIAVVGGEGMSENLRDRITGVDPQSPGGFKAVYSSYGASDLDINIGNETEFSVALRKECQKNPALAKELFGGKSGIPMIFQYDPLNYFIESDARDHLLYTSVTGKKISPRIRYDVHDIGRVMTAKELKKKLKKFNIDIKPQTNLPFLFTWGREGTATTYHSAKVTPEDLEQAIQRVPELKEKIENYAFNAFEEKGAEQKLDFWLELKQGVNIPAENLSKLRDALIEQMRAVNQEFKKMDQDAVVNNVYRPSLKIFPYGQGPLAGQDPHRKKQYIYEGKYSF